MSEDVKDDVKIEEPKEQNIEEVRDNIRNKTRFLYNELVAFISSLPIHDTLKSHSVMNLRQGLQWAIDGVELLDFVKKEDAPDQEASE